jgi:hypothetical protein
MYYSVIDRNKNADDRNHLGLQQEAVCGDQEAADSAILTGCPFTEYTEALGLRNDEYVGFLWMRDDEKHSVVRSVADIEANAAAMGAGATAALSSGGTYSCSATSRSDTTVFRNCAKPSCNLSSWPVTRFHARSRPYPPTSPPRNTRQAAAVWTQASVICMPQSHHRISITCRKARRTEKTRQALRPGGSSLRSGGIGLPALGIGTGDADCRSCRAIRRAAHVQREPPVSGDQYRGKHAAAPWKHPYMAGSAGAAPLPVPDKAATAPTTANRNAPPQCRYGLPWVRRCPDRACCRLASGQSSRKSHT